MSPIAIPLTSSSRCSGISSGSASTVISRTDLGEHSALGHADRLAEELDHDPRLDRLVQPDLLQVDVCEVPFAADAAGTILRIDGRAVPPVEVTSRIVWRPPFCPSGPGAARALVSRSPFGCVPARRR